jgi:hypothetical protein
LDHYHEVFDYIEEKRIRTKEKEEKKKRSEKRKSLRSVSVSTSETITSVASASLEGAVTAFIKKKWVIRHAIISPDAITFKKTAKVSLQLGNDHILKLL